MKRLLWMGGLLGVLLAAACNDHGKCCTNGDCEGSDVCSADCRGNIALQGVCLNRCQVDRDCLVGQVCNEIDLNCGCYDAPDGGEGTCSPGVL